MIAFGVEDAAGTPAPASESANNIKILRLLCQLIFNIKNDARTSIPTSRETVKFDHTLPGTIQYCYNDIDYLWRDEEEESSGHNNRPCEQLVMMAFQSRESTKICFNSGALKVLLLRMPTTCTCTVH
jgi:hypothetical protein